MSISRHALPTALIIATLLSSAVVGVRAQTSAIAAAPAASTDVDGDVARVMKQFDVPGDRGHKVVTHTGGLPGYLSKVTLIPDAQLGVAVLTNQESGAAFSALTWLVIDRYLNVPPPQIDWVGAYAKLVSRQQRETAAAEEKAAAARDASSKPSLPLERYAGTYSDAWYGDIAIAPENGKLVMRFTHTPSLTGELEHFQHDTFIARWRDRELRADAYVIFALDADGSIDQIKMRAVSPATDFSFDFQDLLLRPKRR